MYTSRSMAPTTRRDPYRRGDERERLLLIPSTHATLVKKRVPWHQKPHAGCLVLAVLSLFGIAAVLLPSFESPGNITVFRAPEADVRTRQLAGWHEDFSDPSLGARHAVTLAVKQDRDAILAALAQTSDPDSTHYGKHYTQQEVYEISTNKRSIANVRAFIEKATSALEVQVRWSPGFDFVRLEAQVQDLDKIFNAKFRRWERRLRNEVVHETFRTRELAVPKELENHLDGILGALHLPSGQLSHAHSEGADEDSSDTAATAATVEAKDMPATDAKDTATSGAESMGDTSGTSNVDSVDSSLRVNDPSDPSDLALGDAGLTLSSYTDRDPIRIGKPPTRKVVSEHEWVLREAKALALEVGGGEGSENGKKGDKNSEAVKVFKVKVSGDVDDDVVVPVPEETAEETTAETGERYLKETPAHKAVDLELKMAQAEYAWYQKSKTEKAEKAEAEAGSSRALLESVEVPPEGKAVARDSSAASVHEAVEGSETSSNDKAAQHAQPTKAEQTEKAERKAKREASIKNSEKKRASQKKAELEDKANAMFQKMDEEMREMKTFMAEVVHKDEDSGLEEGDEDDEEIDRSGDGEEKGEKKGVDVSAKGDGDDGEDKSSVDTGVSDSSDDIDAGGEDDVPVPVVEAGSEAAKHAVRRVSAEARRKESPVSSEVDSVSDEEPNSLDSVSIPDDFWVADDGGTPHDQLPDAPGVDSSETDSSAASGDGGGYYEYSLNYDAENTEWEWRLTTPTESDATSNRESTYPFESREGKNGIDEEGMDESSSSSSSSDGRLLSGETNAARDKRASQTEERLKTSVTPDKVLGYYNVPRNARVTHPGASIGVAMFAGSTVRARATVQKFAQYFNVSLGEVTAWEVVDGVGSVDQVEGDDLIVASAEGSTDQQGVTLTKPEEGVTRQVDTLVSGIGASPGSVPRRSGGRSKRDQDLPSEPKQPSKSEKIELAVKSTVATAVTEAVESAVDVADAFAQGVGLAVEKGESSMSDKASDKKELKDELNALTGDAGLVSETEKSEQRKHLDSEVYGQSVTEGYPKVSESRNVASEMSDKETHTPSTPAEVGWHDVSSSRLELNLDLQAVTSMARGAKVDVLLASPAQHYGWEALDVVLNLAANPSPPSVLTLTFGGMEKPDLNLDLQEALLEEEAGEGGVNGGVNEKNIPTPDSDSSPALGSALQGNETVPVDVTLTTTAVTTTAATTTTAASDPVYVSSQPVSSQSSSSASDVARGIEDNSKPRPSYVKFSNSWDTFTRVDTEFAKLGLRGVTVIAAAGDNGPFSFGIPNPYQAWSSSETPCTFQPSFPASMPHVVAVGGTTGGKDAFKPERASSVELGSKITTGGGFSHVFPQPEWQKAAVGRYLKQYAYDLPPESFFNQTNRGYPDVALAADDVALIFTAFGGGESVGESSESANIQAEEGSEETTSTSGTPQHAHPTPSRGKSNGRNTDTTTLKRTGLRLDKTENVPTELMKRAEHYLTESSGTSYSGSLFAGMISLINDARLHANKTTVGFVNPALYALHRTDGPKVFRDIKEGSSKCPNPKMTGAMVGCCKHGFRTGKGWDPLTGLGSVDFSELMVELMKLQ